MRVVFWRAHGEWTTTALPHEISTKRQVSCLEFASNLSNHTQHHQPTGAIMWLRTPLWIVILLSSQPVIEYNHGAFNEYCPQHNDRIGKGSFECIWLSPFNWKLRRLNLPLSRTMHLAFAIEACRRLRDTTTNTVVHLSSRGRRNYIWGAEFSLRSSAILWQDYIKLCVSAIHLWWSECLAFCGLSISLKHSSKSQQLCRAQTGSE